MVFTSTEIENAGRNAYYAGLQRNRNPYEHKNGIINKLKRKIWDYGFDSAKNESKAV